MLFIVTIMRDDHCNGFALSRLNQKPMWSGHTLDKHIWKMHFRLQLVLVATIERPTRFQCNLDLDSVIRQCSFEQHVGVENQ